MNRARRTAFVGLVAGVLVVGGLVPQVERKRPSAIERGPRVPSEAETTATWYCAEGTSQANGRADEEIQIGNVGIRAARAVVTVFAGSDVPPVSRKYRVSAGRVRRIQVSDVAAVADPGVLVEITGGSAVVEHRIVSADDTALGPCAREPARVASFAAGTTAKGAQLWLALFNPFPGDAIVDVRAVTGAGIRAPGPLRGVVVPRFSRVSIPIHDVLPRVDLVGTEVTTRQGRVVAEQSLSLDGSDGRRGLALTLGGDRSRRWRFPIGLTGSGHTERLVLANAGEQAGVITVRFALDAAAAIEPETLTLPGETAVALDLARVPPDIPFSIDVESTQPMMAELIGASADPEPVGVRGIASDLGFTTGARRWAIVPSRFDEESADTVALVSADGRRHRAQLLRSDGGRRQLIARVTVPASGRVLLDLARFSKRADLALLVRADGPVVVERESAGPGLTRSHAVPGGP